MNSAIEVRNLTKQYPGFALKDVSFQIPVAVSSVLSEKTAREKARR